MHLISDHGRISARAAASSRCLRAALLLSALATALVARPVLGQDTSRVASADSLIARLKALEASVEVLQKQIAEQAGRNAAVDLLDVLERRPRG